jgi:tetratricopeptide (TPR) repeat protein
MAAPIPEPRPELRDARSRVLLAAALVVLAGLAAYHGGFRGPFLYDDIPGIVQNPSIRSLSDLGAVLDPPARAGTAQGRPVLNLSLAFNYALGGLDPLGYHLANLAIHIGAGLALFGLTRRTLLLPRLRDRFGRAALPLALATAVVWTVHPLQTESVAYTIQRAESLMGLFYFLTLYGLARSSSGGRGWAWLSFGCCLLGMGTKEVMVSAPVVALLYDRAFLSDGWAEAWRRRKALYASLAGTWLLLALLVASGGGNRGGTIGFGVPHGWDYFLTQGRAIARYLRLAVWPDSLVLDYGTIHERSLLSAARWDLPVLLLLAGAFAAWRRAPSVGFLGLWFFAILAPTSLVPGTTQMIVEHRMYVALAPVAGLAVVGLNALIGRRSLWIWPAVAAVLCWATVLRVRDYRSEVAIWSDAVRLRPWAAGTHYFLGHALAADPARRPEAIAELERSIELDPANADAHDTLGLLLAQEPGRIGEALDQYREAIRLDPADAKARNNLGYALLGLPGGLPEAVSQLEEAERLDPDRPEIRVNLGHALERTPGRLADAVSEYRAAIRIAPDAATLTDLGAALTRLPGRSEEAIGDYRRALALDPGYARAHNDLGSALASAPGGMAEAIGEFQEAVRLDPGYASARCNLGSALAGVPGRMGDAIAQLREAARLDPNLLEARYNLGMLLSAFPGSRAEAIAQFEEVLRLRPDFEPAREMLGQLGADQRGIR